MSKFAILFLASLSVGSILTLFQGAVWGVYLYEIVYFLNPTGRWWYSQLPGISYSFFIVLTIIFSILIRIKGHLLNKITDAPQTKWLIIFFCLYCLSYFTAVAPSLHLTALTQLFKLFIIVSLIYLTVDTERKLDFALIAYLIGATYIGWETYSVGRNGMGRVEGVGTIDSPDANGAAAVIAPAAALLIYYGWRSTFKMKLVFGFFAVWIMNGLVLINSRGAFLGVMAGVGYMISHMLFSKIKLPSQRATAIFIIFVGVLMAYYLTDDLFWERMETLQHVEEEDKSGSSRVRFWLKTFDMIESKPFGLGVKGYDILSPIYIDERYLSPTTQTRVAHSMWFQCLGEVGWFGLLTFILVLLSSFSLSRKVKKHLVLLDEVNAYFRVIAVEAAFISYLVASTFIDQVRTELIYWFIIFIACLGNIHIFRESNLNQKELKDKA